MKIVNETYELKGKPIDFIHNIIISLLYNYIINYYNIIKNINILNIIIFNIIKNIISHWMTNMLES